MAFLLNIDTAVTSASVCFSNGSLLLGSAKNEDPRDHAAWLHQAIQTITAKAGLQLQELDGIAVTIGPGSYTGLRVGLSTAKGLCFALGKPLITIGTLEMMAKTLVGRHSGLLCPLIDARRMEVFAAVFNQSMEIVVEPCAMILDKESFNELLTDHSIIFAGNGSKKLQAVISNSNAVFIDEDFTANDMIMLSDKYFNERKFADLAYTEPMYLKEFYFPNSHT